MSKRNRTKGKAHAQVHAETGQKDGGRASSQPAATGEAAPLVAGDGAAADRPQDQPEGTSGADALPGDAAMDGGGNGAGGEVSEELHHVEDPSLAPADCVVQAAEEACRAVANYLGEYWPFQDSEIDRIDLLCGDVHSKGTNAMAALVRKIGPKRATPDVIGQQLKIDRLIDDAAISPAERLLIETFVTVLAGIDAFEAGEKARAEQAARPDQTPPPLPIDETTMEPVDGHFDTWGR